MSNVLTAVRPSSFIDETVMELGVFGPDSNGRVVIYTQESLHSENEQEHYETKFHLDKHGRIVAHHGTITDEAELAVITFGSYVRFPYHLNTGIRILRSFDSRAFTSRIGFKLKVGANLDEAIAEFVRIISGKDVKPFILKLDSAQYSAHELRDHLHYYGRPAK